MNLNLTLSKKTYYALGMLSAACAMAQALGAAVGYGMALAGNISTLLTLLMLGFLASVKGTTRRDKGALAGCILLQVLALALPIALVQHVLLALVWPCFAGYEKNRDARLAPQWRAVCGAEILWFAARVLVQLGGVSVLGFGMNLCGLLAAAARAWLTLTLYRRQRDEG